MNQKIYEEENIEGLCRCAAELIIATGLESVRKRGLFTLVLTGGRTVQALYKYLVEMASEPELKNILSKTCFFLGDERWVPEDHRDSNGGMVRRLLLEPLGITDERIFLIPTGLVSPEGDAADYENTLRHFFAKELSGDNDFPEFDLILLGMGDDGHVASLFPGTAALQEGERWVTTSFPPYLSPAVDRVTMTMPILNRAGEVVLLVTGTEKQAIVRKIMADPQKAANIFPAGFLKSSGRKIWLLADS